MSDNVKSQVSKHIWSKRNVCLTTVRQRREKEGRANSEVLEVDSAGSDLSEEATLPMLSYIYEQDTGSTSLNAEYVMASSVHLLDSPPPSPTNLRETVMPIPKQNSGSGAAALICFPETIVVHRATPLHNGGKFVWPYLEYLLTALWKIATTERLIQFLPLNTPLCARLHELDLHFIG